MSLVRSHWRGQDSPATLLSRLPLCVQTVEANVYRHSCLGKRPNADPVTRAVFCKYSISKRHTFDVTISYNQISISYIFRFPRKYFSLFYLHVSEIILIFAPFHADTCTMLQTDGGDDIHYKAFAKRFDFDCVRISQVRTVG